MIGITNNIVGIIIISHCTLISFVISQTQVVVSNNACFNAMDRTNSTIFSAPYAGVVESVELEHVSGGNSCLQPHYAQTNWGCLVPTSLGLQVSLQKTSGMDAWGSSQYPKLNDTTRCDHGCAACPCWVWNSASYNLSSPSIVMHGNMTVNLTDTFSLQNCEAVCEHHHLDNEGIACAKVTFTYSLLITQNPTSTPTLAPSDAPTSSPTLPTGAPSLSPSQVPTIEPSVEPSPSPSSAPTKLPTTETEKDPDPEVDNFQMMIIFIGGVLVLLCVGFVVVYICYKQLTKKQTIHHQQIPQINVVSNPGAHSFHVQRQMVNDHHVSMQDY